MRSIYSVSRRAWVGCGVAALVMLSLVLRVHRLEGPADLRFDAGVYYVLGTSIAQGKGLSPPE